jgi:macrodomain Ter protein organizer (MatP/YcbG family)
MIRNMTAAWRQKQYRDRQVERKSYSFILDTTLKTQFNRLARRQKKTISEMLEDLIKQAVLKAEKAETKRKSASPRGS